MQECYKYEQLKNIPTVLTIHNAQYQGWMNWELVKYLPDWNRNNWGKLDWNNSINPLASAVKCSHKVTTVSHSYLQELRHHSNGLEDLFEYEKGKCIGILNGIDTTVWNAEDDKYLEAHYNSENVLKGKHENKLSLCNEFNLDPTRPLFVFIGRLVHEKAADLLPQAIYDAVLHLEGKMNFLILGSGEPHVEWQLSNLTVPLAGYYNSRIGYNEKLSHRMYAGADFLLMPSRIEPCGLNQMYALRYGTIPLVRNTGGLKDTIVDIGEPGGYGIIFNEAKVWDITYSIHRAMELYTQKERMENIQKKIMNIDNSWENSAKQYLNLYKSL
jgi:starch synthase